MGPASGPLDVRQVRPGSLPPHPGGVRSIVPRGAERIRAAKPSRPPGATCPRASRTGRSRTDRGGSSVLRLDTGNTAFMLHCSSLVMLMTPGPAFFYGGLVGRKNVLAIMIQSFVSLCWTTVVWFVCGYLLCFSGRAGGRSEERRVG